MKWLKLLYQIPAIFFLGVPVKRKKRTAKRIQFPDNNQHPTETWDLS
jgi:hypothetical protein